MRKSSRRQGGKTREAWPHRAPPLECQTANATKALLPLPATRASLFSCLAGKMASRKEGTGSTATSSGSTTGAVGKGKGKGGSGDSAVKQVQIDGLVSGVPWAQAHVGSALPSRVPPDALPLGLVGLAQGVPLIPVCLVFTFCSKDTTAFSVFWGENWGLRKGWKT
jgi:hypothetical protein